MSFHKWENVVFFAACWMLFLWVYKSYLPFALFTTCIVFEHYVDNSVHFKSAAILQCAEHSSLNLLWILLWSLVDAVVYATLRLVAFSSHENSLRHLLSMLMNGKHGSVENWNTLKWANVNWMSDWKRDGSAGSECVSEKLEKSTANGKKVEYITRWMGADEKKLHRFLCQRHFAELSSCFEASVFTCLLLCDIPSQATPQHDAHFADVRASSLFKCVSQLHYHRHGDANEFWHLIENSSRVVH